MFVFVVMVVVVAVVLVLETSAAEDLPAAEGKPAKCPGTKSMVPRNGLAGQSQNGYKNDPKSCAGRREASATL